MPFETITVTRLADLRLGDRITSCDGVPYKDPRVVMVELSPIEPGSPVWGVRLQNPRPENRLEPVFYPSQMDGHRLEVQRYIA